MSDGSCWFLQECAEHPEGECSEGGEWFPVATDGRFKWVNCPVCNGVWFAAYLRKKGLMADSYPKLRVRLVLTEREARWLKVLLQTVPLYEPREEREVREAIFTALHKELS